MTAAAPPALPPLPPPPPFRVGLGYDLHRLVSTSPARPLILGGVEISRDVGPISHSDGDAVLHALTDAILGALAEPDIGELFPDSDPANAGRDSAAFLGEALRRMRQAGYSLANADITLILEQPKISPHKDRVRRRLAELLTIPLDCVNLKGKTHEQVDAVGEGRAVEVHAVVLLYRVGTE
ncbi:MAG: 2-C-methyl-D-erythritol 2,4-cyclodiphosphate synthase, partial [Phycisphaerales bacterium]|nr:2-C-methyl-D-erythritol 2,4-cyclodiphosphate synthase [Phycisphaerales bacterium]